MSHKLSEDSHNREIKMLEHFYGGHLRSQRAARIIQNAYRIYRLKSEYARMRMQKEANREPTGSLLHPINPDKFCHRSPRFDPRTSQISAISSGSLEDLFLEQAYVDWALKAATAQATYGIPPVSDVPSIAACDGAPFDLVPLCPTPASYAINPSEQSDSSCLINGLLSPPQKQNTTYVTSTASPRDLGLTEQSAFQHSSAHLSTLSDIAPTSYDRPCHVTTSLVAGALSLGRLASTVDSLKPPYCTNSPAPVMLSCELPRRRTYPSRESSSPPSTDKSSSRTEESIITPVISPNQWDQPHLRCPHATSRSTHIPYVQHTTTESSPFMVPGLSVPVSSRLDQQPGFQCSCSHCPRSHIAHTSVANAVLRNRSTHLYSVPACDRLGIHICPASTSNRTFPKSTSHCHAMFGKYHTNHSCRPIFVAVPSSMMEQCYTLDRDLSAPLSHTPSAPLAVKYTNSNHILFRTPCYVNHRAQSNGAQCCSSTSHPPSIASVAPIHHTTTQLGRHQLRVWEKRRKRTYRIGLNLFNKSPLKGLDFLIKWNFLDCAPESVARFLLTRKGVSRAAIGDYLGNTKDEMAMSTTRQFMRQLNFAGLEVDEALRFLLSCFRTPGESQKIVHLLTEFQSAYVEQNADRVKDQFRNPDSVMILAYAIVMLHTDMYSPSVRPQSKMTKEEFVRNLRGVDAGEDINRDMLSAIYDRIKQAEMSVLPDHTDQVRKIQLHLMGPNCPTSLAVPQRRLVCYCRLYEVPDRHKKERPGAHQREVFLFNDILLITKAVQKRRRDATVAYQVRMCLSLLGMHLSTFEAAHYPYGLELATSPTDSGPRSSGEPNAVCSALPSAGIHTRILVAMNTKTASDRARFLEDLQECILEVAEMDRIRLEEEKAKAVPNQKRIPKKSSGTNGERFYNKPPDIIMNHVSLPSQSKTQLSCTVKPISVPFLTNSQHNGVFIRKALGRDSHDMEYRGILSKTSISAVDFPISSHHRIATCSPYVIVPGAQLSQLAEREMKHSGLLDASQHLSNDSGLPTDLERPVSLLTQVSVSSPCSSPI
ncbi:unnamed protein product [Dicrocoelium dendriticum]|nr:unnamed protein product [Dicrocoelium dendriticum]